MTSHGEQIVSDPAWRNPAVDVEQPGLGARALDWVHGHFAYPTNIGIIRTVLEMELVEEPVHFGEELPVPAFGEPMVVRIERETLRPAGRRLPKGLIDAEDFDRRVADMQDVTYSGPSARMLVEEDDADPVIVEKNVYFYRGSLSGTQLNGAEASRLRDFVGLPPRPSLTPPIRVGLNYHGERQDELTRISEAVVLTRPHRGKKVRSITTENIADSILPPLTPGVDPSIA